MELINQIKRDKVTFRRLDKKKRWQFVWDYYKIPILSAAFVLLIAVMILFGIGGAKKSLYVVMVNANREIGTEARADLFEDIGLVLDADEVDLETNYTLDYDNITETDVQTVEVLAVRFGIGDMDVFAANEAVFESYAKKDAFADLSLFLSPELLQAYEADLYRYNNTDGHEIVGGIWLREGSPLHKAGFYHGDVLIGVLSLAQNLDNALHLVQQLLAD